MGWPSRFTAAAPPGISRENSSARERVVPRCGVALERRLTPLASPRGPFGLRTAVCLRAQRCRPHMAIRPSRIPTLRRGPLLLGSRPGSPVRVASGSALSEVVQHLRCRPRAPTHPARTPKGPLLAGSRRDSNELFVHANGAGHPCFPSRFARPSPPRCNRFRRVRRFAGVGHCLRQRVGVSGSDKARIHSGNFTTDREQQQARRHAVPQFHSPRAPARARGCTYQFHPHVCR